MSVAINGRFLPVIDIKTQGVCILPAVKFQGSIPSDGAAAAARFFSRQ